MEAALTKNSVPMLRDVLRADPQAAVSFLLTGGRIGFESPLSAAIRAQCSVEVVKLLLEHRAEFCQRDSDNKTPLMLCATAETDQLTERAFADGDDFVGCVLLPPRRGGGPAVMTAFEFMTLVSEEEKHSQMARALVLLAAGADPDEADDLGRTAGQIARDSGRHKLARALDNYRNVQAGFVLERFRRHPAGGSMATLGEDALRHIQGYLIQGPLLQMVHAITWAASAA